MQQHNRYWGKATQGVGYHLLQCHCLDVAAVLQVLLQRDALLARRVADISPLPVPYTQALLLFFAAIHDLGKFSPIFQHKIPELAATLGVPGPAAQDRHHTALGLTLWHAEAQPLCAALGLPQRFALEPLAQAGLCHHGKPLDYVPDDAQHQARCCFAGTAQDALAFVREAGERLLRGPCPVAVDEDALKPLSWLAAGLIVLADWIGSNSQWFAHREVWPGWDAYWAQALTLAERAVEESGLLSPPPSTTRDFHTLFPHLERTCVPSPMQAAMLDLTPPEEPCCLIIEDLTGGGKTEAALLAAQAMRQAGLAQSLFVGLPTMATANAMYGRLAASYRALFDPPDASLVLTHGARGIHETYLKSILLEQGVANTVPDGHTPDSNATCNAWLADHRKKALLAPCGVGTLDQALLAALPVRHQCLRLLGLSRAVLIVDEVHAYDSYTGELLRNLLTLHATLGGSAVLLSATLPQETRRALAEAFLEGRRRHARLCDEMEEAATAPLKEQHFPLATVIAASGVVELPVQASRPLDVQVEPVHAVKAMEAELLAARGRGACVCWIRNTVGDAVATFQRLREVHGVPAEDILLFHARFTAFDRLRIEAAVLEWFGKTSTPQQRRGKVLIATQVVEQSLDLDFDLLLTDLAPMELMIQRAGRCHRHCRERPSGMDAARMVVLMPEPFPDPPADWYASMFPAGQHVYPRPALLWRTARLLCEARRLLLPENARALIEGAYDECAATTPKALARAECKALGDAKGERSLALRNALKPCRGYSGNFDEDIRYPTRLGEESLDLRLLRQEQGRLQLWAADSPEDVSMAACLRSQVRCNARHLAAALSESLQGQVSAFAQRLPDQGRWSVLLPLQQTEPGRWEGWGKNRDGERVRVRYGAQGLEIIASM